MKGEDLTSEQLESVAAEVFEELGNMDQTPVQHEIPVETTLEKRKGRSHQHRRWEFGRSCYSAFVCLFVYEVLEVICCMYCCCHICFLSFRMLRVGTIKSFVDVITTVGRLPHIEMKQE